MRALVLWGSPTSANLGVRVLGEGAQAVLDRAGFTDVVQYNFGDIGPGFEIGRRNLLKELVKPGPITHWLSGFDIVFDTGSGDSFADIYGQQRLQHLCMFRKLAIKANVTTVLGPQTVGPFDSMLGRSVARWSLMGVSAVMTRDARSDQAVKHLAPSTTRLSSTDLVFALPPVNDAVRSGVLVNVSGLLWNPNKHVDYRVYQRTMMDYLGMLSDRGVSHALLAHVHGSQNQLDDDSHAVSSLLSRGFDVESHFPSNLTSARELIGAYEVVVGARMHACLNALSLGVPSLALAYSRKFAPLMQDIGWSHVRDLKSGPSASQLLEHTMQLVDAREEAARVAVYARSRLDSSLEKLSETVLKVNHE
ncbi:hypothetical protein CH289_05585 [Rhodococcus sp. RS1C4]|nr:polysaccharide pyruvyl transferase family protein [Rhodococcus sp. RS1C4]OZC56194.1 hypothetical protein CH289_05585 [Rhodococcus sp. RS1C4]